MTLHEIRVAEWSTVDPSSPGGEVLRGKRLASSRSRALADSLRRDQKLEIDELAVGLRIQSLSFVGRIVLDDLIITIEPKIAGEDLLALLCYAYTIRDVQRFETVPIGAHGKMLQDLLAIQLLQEASALCERGLHRAYVERADRLSSPRGRIDIGSVSRSAAISAELPCIHSPRLADNPVNRVLAAGLRLAAHLSVDLALRVSLRRLHARVGTEVSDVRLTAGLLKRVRGATNRQTAGYEPALLLIELLFDGHAASVAAGDALDIPGFLFDMNRFFETLVGRFLTDHLEHHEVRTQHALHGLIAYRPDKNPLGRGAPSPRPDFAVFRDKQLLTFLDAKYRDLWEHSLPRDMLYQLALYATASNDSSATIVYPTANRAAREAAIDIRDPSSGRARAAILLRPLVLPLLAELLRVPHALQSRKVLARSLVFGMP